MCDKKVRYSDAKKKELHVFPQMEFATLPVTSIGAMAKLADQVLERICKRMTFVEHELEMGEWFRYSQVLVKFSAQKSASSVNF